MGLKTFLSLRSPYCDHLPIHKQHSGDFTATDCSKLAFIIIKIIITLYKKILTSPWCRFATLMATLYLSAAESSSSLSSLSDPTDDMYLALSSADKFGQCSAIIFNLSPKLFPLRSYNFNTEQSSNYNYSKNPTNSCDSQQELFILLKIILFIMGQ